jgi:hypothetical protein
MDREEAKEFVTTVEASSSEKKMLEQYEPSEATVGFTAKIPDDADVDPEAVQNELSDLAREKAREEVLERWEMYIRKEMEDDD